jgi:sulfide dehydrogenase cytochrome subunit
MNIKHTFFIFAMTGSMATFADPMPGEMAAQSCGACHGTQGKLTNEAFPALAGMPKAQFVQAMVDFKSGKRASTLMAKVAEGFTPAEYEAMADYFAAQKLD